jgi:hypothetical protein
LNLPLVVYGHHSDVEDGLDSVLAVVERIQALGPLRWLSLSQIARSNYQAARQSDSELAVRLHSVLAEVPVPAGVDTLCVELPHLTSVPAEELEVRFEGRTVPIESEPGRPAHALLHVTSGTETARIEVRSARGERYEDVAAPSPRIWPVLRRATTEARDRFAPLRHRLSRVASRTTS